LYIPTTTLAQGGSGALTHIQTQLLGADAASVTFSGIPGTYEHLWVQMVVRGTNAGNPTLRAQFNGDGGANYDYELLAGVGNAPAAAATGGQTSGYLADFPAANSPASYAGTGTLTIPGYRRTTFFKSYHSEGACIRGAGASDYVMTVTAGLWHSTAAITSIAIFPNADNLLTGSLFSLYGIIGG
jgi:hypothetical protein